MLNRIIRYSFYILFFATPIFWTPFNFELFEYNKMMLVYFLTAIITAAWLWKMIQEKKLIFSSTPLNIPILLFLGANILSTIFSIDVHTSIWGYYSRSNGGLLSIISYTLLYFALVSNFKGEDALKFLKAAVFGGLVVALYAIPEHFGVSPSCVILTKKFSADCWVQDVQARVFATLGQPNWLAAYLTMLIFPCIYFTLTAKNKFSSILYALYSMLFYLAFTFSYSRGATLGFWAGLLIFIAFSTISKLRFNPWGFKLNLNKSILIILAVFVLINLVFGSALSNLKLLSKFAPPPRPGLITKAPLTSGTQLENGGTESGQIRLIVWQGAWEIFKHYPIFGSGVETFAYSYYRFRPASHNLVSEWDFLYNKAHNEYLNYLANTGIIGFVCYFFMIITFIVVVIKKLKKNFDLLSVCLLASYISYLVQNFFGFSVVVIAVFFYLFPAITFLTDDLAKQFVLPKKQFAISYKLSALIYRRPFYTNLTKTLIVIIFGLIIITLARNYWADTYFAAGNNASDHGNPGRAYNQLTSAVSLNPGEPYYRSELAFAAAASAVVALAREDTTTSARLIREAVSETEKALNLSPNNVSFYRARVRTYYLLSTLEENFIEKTLQTLDKTISLAPTDTKLIYNKAIILGQTGKNKEAIENFEKSIFLKPNYTDAYYTLGLFYFDEGQKQKAIEQMQKVLQLIPDDPDALKKLQEWGR